MSLPKSNPTVYDGLMLVSLGAVIVGIIFLVLQLNSYGWSNGG